MARLNRLPWRMLAGLVLAVAGLALGWLWFRDSSFAAVRQVTVSGSTSSEDARVRAALESAGRGMSTLHVDTAALHDAVEPFSSVADLRVRADFPHDLRIEVIEHEPVAVLQSGGSRVPVTGAGLLLQGVEAKDLPVVTSKAPPLDGRVQGRRALGALEVAAAAPKELRARAERLFWSEDGLSVELRDGPELIFGAATRLRAKWAAAARVLADLEARGASYVDLRIPGRPAVGGLAAATLTPVAPAGTGLGVAPSGSTDLGVDSSVTAPTAQSAVPSSGSSDTTATTTTPPAESTEPAAPQPPAQSAEPLTAGAGGGATASP
jgi:cell division protein FtsQ